MDARPGSRLGPYEFLDRLGSGGMGEVYRARDLRLDRVVAVKVLRADRVSDPKSRQTLMHEARALSSLNNSHVAVLFDVVSQEDSDCLVMEYVPGSSLDRVISRTPMPVRVALEYAIQIADALAAAHARNLIHRDLKPSNIAATPEGSIKLLDFGIAKHLHARHGSEEKPAADTGQTAWPTSVLAGTPAYMSPEQISGQRLDERTDIFSFGAVLYEMLTGHRVFERPTLLATGAAILHENPPPVTRIAPDAPPEMDAIVARCLQKDRDRRFRRIASVKRLLEGIARRLEADQAPPAPERRRRSRRLVIASVLVVLAIVGFGGWTLLTPPADKPLIATPLTSYPGFASAPAFSPDGTFVAFQWDGLQQNNTDIYVKAVGEGDPLQLTSDPDPDLSPAWSPDGHYIAFVRVRENSAAVMLVPALGGKERAVAALPPGTVFNWHLQERLLAWTPDGKWLAVPWLNTATGNTNLSLVEAQTGEVRDLTTISPRARGLRDHDPAFSSDGRLLAYARNSSPFAADLFVLPLARDYAAAGEPRQLTAGPGMHEAPAFFPDRRELVFQSMRGDDSEILRIAASGGRARPLSGIGENGMLPALSSRKRLVYVNPRVLDTNIWKLPLQANGALPTALLTSSRIDTTPQISPDGSRVVFQSDRQGHMELWLGNADGSHAFPLTNFGRGHTGTPRWSPDGGSIVFDSNVSGLFQVYTIGIGDRREPRKLTGARMLAAIPSWSRDGRWIYYTSNDTGRDEIWKVPAEGGPAVQVTFAGGAVPFEGFDDSLYYLRGGALWSMPRDGGAERRVLGSVRNREYAVARRGIYFARELDPSRIALRFYSFETGKETQLYQTLRPTHSGLTVSPDETWLLYTQVDHEGSDLMLADFAK